MQKGENKVHSGAQYRLLGNGSSLRKFFTSNRLLGDQIVLPSIGHSTRRMVGFWLLGTAGLVFITFASGGMARLANYGQQMVNWDLVKRLVPPTDATQWEREYERYRSSPEWKYASSAHVATERQLVSFEDFKTLWKQEYLHRMARGALFVGFFAPFGFFWYRGWLSSALKTRLSIAGGILASQVMLDWMLTRSIKTGHYDTPRFGQFRLATHLGGNYVAYAIFLWTGLSHFIFPHTDYNKLPNMAKFKGSLQITAMLLATQIFIGALVASTDAGHIMNTWPSYDGKFWPEASLLTKEHPIWKNFYDNPTLIQMAHRHFGYYTMIAVVTTWFIGRSVPLDARTRMALNAVLAVALTQASLGILTLINQVPVWLGSLHQGGSITLATVTLWLMNELRSVPK